MTAVWCGGLPGMRLLQKSNWRNRFGRCEGCGRADIRDACMMESTYKRKPKNAGSGSTAEGLPHPRRPALRCVRLLSSKYARVSDFWKAWFITFVCQNLHAYWHIIGTTRDKISSVDIGSRSYAIQGRYRHFNPYRRRSRADGAVWKAKQFRSVKEQAN